MKQKIKKIAAGAAATLAALTAPAVTFAQNNYVNSGLSGLTSYFGYGLTGSTTLTQLIGNVIRLLLTFAGAVAVLFIIIGGFWYITSAGNEETAEKGKKTLINAIIGIIIITLAYVIVTVLVNTITYGY